MGNDGIKNKFDDIDIKVDFLIELCQTLQVENLELNSKIKIGIVICDRYRRCAGEEMVKNGAGEANGAAS